MRIDAYLTAALLALGACATTHPCAPAPQPTASAPTLTTEESAAPEVRSAAASPQRQVGEGRARITLLAQGHNAFVGRLELAAGAAVPEHSDPTEEYIHVLSGQGVLTMEGVRYEVEPGTTIFMPANAKVSFQNGDAPMVALQVFAGPGPAAKYDSWQPVTP